MLEDQVKAALDHRKNDESVMKEKYERVIKGFEARVVTLQQQLLARDQALAAERSKNAELSDIVSAAKQKLEEHNIETPALTATIRSETTSPQKAGHADIVDQLSKENAQLHEKLKQATLRLTEERVAKDMALARRSNDSQQVLMNLEKALEAKEVEIFELLDKQSTLEAELREKIEREVRSEIEAALRAELETEQPIHKKKTESLFIEPAVVED